MIDPELRAFLVRQRRLWRNTLAAWELRTTYRREKARRGEVVRPYKKHALGNQVRSCATHQ